MDHVDFAWPAYVFGLWVARGQSTRSMISFLVSRRDRRVRQIILSTLTMSVLQVFHGRGAGLLTGILAVRCFVFNELENFECIRDDGRDPTIMV